MNITVIVEDTFINNYKKWSEVEKNHPTLTKDDFVKHGEDYITLLDADSYRITRDIKLLESVATEQIFGKKKVDWATVIMTALITFVAVIIGT